MSGTTEVADPEARSALCRAILADLPGWFGRPEATAAYVEAAATPTTFAWEVDGVRAGFAGLSRPTSETFDIHVMGVLRRHHRRGGGRALLAACEDRARGAGAAFLTVRTVGPSTPDPFYEQTRAFYRACNMAALGVVAELWRQA